LSTKAEVRAEQLRWRRSKVVEMRARGLNQLEIARELQVSEASISSDMRYLRNQAKEYIKKYVTEHLPEQYQVCLCALDTIIKRAFDMLNTAEDNREKLQAMELYKDTHLVKLELLSNATTIDSALDYIRSMQQPQPIDTNSNNNNGRHYDDHQLVATTAEDNSSSKQTIF
jgi:hypothetical protein